MWLWERRAVGWKGRQVQTAACSTSCCSRPPAGRPMPAAPSIAHQGLRTMKAALLLLFAAAAVVLLAAGQGPPTTYMAQLNASNEASACRGLKALACAPPPSACCTEGGGSPPAFTFGRLPTLNPPAAPPAGPTSQLSHNRHV